MKNPKVRRGLALFLVLAVVAVLAYFVVLPQLQGHPDNRAVVTLVDGHTTLNEGSTDESNPPKTIDVPTLTGSPISWVAENDEDVKIEVDVIFGAKKATDCVDISLYIVSQNGQAVQGLFSNQRDIVCSENNSADNAKKVIFTVTPGWAYRLAADGYATAVSVEILRPSDASSSGDNNTL